MVKQRTKVLVTGGAGFIGSNLTDELIKLGYEVVVIDNLSLGKKEYINPKAKFYQKDIRNFEDIEPLFRGVKCVFHLAALPRIQPSIINPAPSFDNNVRGTFNVLLAAKEAQVPRVVFSASSSVYGDQKRMPLKEKFIAQPKSPYSLFKYMGEEMSEMFHRIYGLPTVCLRYFNVYGERQTTEGAYATVIGKFLLQRSLGQPLTVVADAKRKARDFTYVKDVVRANILAMKSAKAVGHVINIGTGRNYSVFEVAKLVNHPRIIIPKRPAESLVTLADNSKAKRLLGWSPRTTLEQWLKSQT